jgi:hypothetical protein
MNVKVESGLNCLKAVTQHVAAFTLKPHQAACDVASTYLLKQNSVTLHQKPATDSILHSYFKRVELAVFVCLFANSGVIIASNF